MKERKLRLLELSDDEAHINEMLDSFLGDNPINFYTDYHDFEDIEKLVVKYETLEEFEDAIYQSYENGIYEYVSELECDAISFIKEGYQDYDDLSEELVDYIRDYVQDNATINIPYDDYLNYLIRVNMFITFKSSTDAETLPYDKKTMSKILEKLGYVQTLTTLKEVEKADYKSDDRFLMSIHNEIINSFQEQYNYFCVIGEISIKEYFKIKANPRSTFIKFNHYNYCGFVDPYNGGGSVLGIELPKDNPLTCKGLNVIKMLVEHSGEKYTVDDIYGLTSKCYQRIEVKYNDNI